MPVEERVPVSGVFVDQAGAVARATSKRSRSGDISRDVVDVSRFALELVRCGNDSGQRLGLGWYIVGPGVMAGFTIGDARLGEQQLGVDRILLHLGRVREIDITNIELLGVVNCMDVGVDRAPSETEKQHGKLINNECAVCVGKSSSFTEKPNN
jgi:hypothetical protein